MARGKRIHEILTGRRIAFPTGEVYNTGVKNYPKERSLREYAGVFGKGTDRSGHHRRYPGIPGEVSGGAGHGGTGAEAPVSLLRKRSVGGGGSGPAVRGKPAAGRQQGHRQERAGGEPGHGLWPSGLGRVVPCEHGRRQPHRHGYLCGRGGYVPARPGVSVRQKRRVRHSG